MQNENKLSMNYSKKIDTVKVDLLCDKVDKEKLKAAIEKKKKQLSKPIEK